MLLPLLMNLGMLGRANSGGGERLRLPKQDDGRNFANLGVIRTPEDIRKARERFGVLPKAAEVIADVAAQQVDLSLDQQQRLEHLERELQAVGLEYESRYLELLNATRERLIGQEIARLLKERMKQEDEALVLILAASI